MKIANTRKWDWICSRWRVDTVFILMLYSYQLWQPTIHCEKKKTQLQLNVKYRNRWLGCFPSKCFIGLFVGDRCENATFLFPFSFLHSSDTIYEFIHSDLDKTANQHYKHRSAQRLCVILNMNGCARNFFPSRSIRFFSFVLCQTALFHSSG